VFANLDALAAGVGPVQEAPRAVVSKHAAATVFVGASREARASSVLAYLREMCIGWPSLRVALIDDAGAWPFQRHVGVNLPGSGPVAIWARNLYEAFRPDRRAAHAWSSHSRRISSNAGSTGWIASVT
jgi:hypothetical protein